MNIQSKLNLYTVFLGKRLAGRIENIGNDKKELIKMCRKLNIFYKIYKGKEYNNEFIIFSKNNKIVNYLFMCHTHKILNDDEKIGKLYGYPECCSKDIIFILKKDSSFEEKNILLKIVEK